MKALRPLTASLMLLTLSLIHISLGYEQMDYYTPIRVKA